MMTPSSSSSRAGVGGTDRELSEAQSLCAATKLIKVSID